jgi:hypothetical protein
MLYSGKGDHSDARPEAAEIVCNDDGELKMVIMAI